MARVKRSTMEERQMRMLAYLLGKTEGEWRSRVALSLNAISDESGLNRQQTRLVLKNLKDAGLLRIEPRELSNGGTAENAYRVTPKGRRVLAACGAAGQAAGSGRLERVGASKVPEGHPMGG